MNLDPILSEIISDNMVLPYIAVAVLAFAVCIVGYVVTA